MGREATAGEGTLLTGNLERCKDGVRLRVVPGVEADSKGDLATRGVLGAEIRLSRRAGEGWMDRYDVWISDFFGVTGTL